ncbi:MAG: redoxin domain-containing protein [Candidatus Micrarchaeia archaeon]
MIRKFYVLAIGIAVAIAIMALAFHQSFNSYISTVKTSISSPNITIGSPAPNYSFMLVNGSYESLYNFKGHPVLLWFVATWCSGCVQGNEILNQNYGFFKSRGIKIIELELYNDLGYKGPNIGDFASSYAPSAYGSGTIIPAFASYNMSAAYDPSGYLDIYYLISSNGTVIYENNTLALTLNGLEKEINSSLQ